MRFFTAIALLAAIVFITDKGLVSQEKKDPPTKTKGFLPPNWGKLDLSAEQKQAIYRVQAKYKEDITKLKDKIKEMEIEERREMGKLLTDEQKKKLAEITTGEKPKEEPKKVDPKKEKDKGN